MSDLIETMREAINDRVAGTAMIQACYLEAACEEIERLERELAECKAKAIDYEVKRDVAVNTLDLVKAERTAAQKALAAQCSETKVLRQERVTLAAQLLQMREALDCVEFNNSGVCPICRCKTRYQHSDGCIMRIAVNSDTKPAESVINAVKDQALWELSEKAKTDYVATIQQRCDLVNWLRRMADELEKK